MGAASRALPNGDAFLIEGPIAPKYFLPQTWAHQLQDSLGKHRYATFVCLMISRIRAEKSEGEEVRRFFALLDTDGKDDFMQPVEEHLPELEMAL